jgi:hypothetical protein
VSIDSTTISSQGLSMILWGMKVEPRRRFRGCREISDVLLQLEAEVGLFCDGKPSHVSYDFSSLTV